MKFGIFLIMCLFYNCVNSYMAREYFEHTSSSGQVVRKPLRTILFGWQQYVRNVCQELIYEIEELGLCNIFLMDFTQDIKRNFFEYEVIGQIKYTDGFIGSLQEASFLDKDENYWVDQLSSSAYLKSRIVLSDIMLYFNFDANLTHTQFSGTVGIPIGGVEFTINITNSYKSKKISGLIQDPAVKLAKNSRWYFEPSNKYTEIIDRDVKWSFFDDFENILKTTITDLLQKVIDRTPFPEICFNCNEHMKLHEF